MGLENRIFFDPFYLDLGNESLGHGSEIIKLRPKAFAVLTYLLGRPGQLVTKEELLKAVWHETFVSEAVLKVIIGQLREALGDDPKSPRFIETAHRRGYRFIGRIAEARQGLENWKSEIDKANLYTAPLATIASMEVVGREEALSKMQGWLEKMLGGERQIVFVTGEAGIGKTALLDAFARSTSDKNVRIGRGQCLEHYGTSEAYLPVLEAIGRLCREQRQDVDLLRAHAPMWLLQMPALASASERELLSREVLGATRERMLREMGDALDAMTAERPLVLILEDLHWSDYSTLDLISYLARQRQSAQLMMIGTYRPLELAVSGHPLKEVKRELLAKQQCDELPLEYLSEDAVAEYLSLRFPVNRFPSQLAGLIHQRTSGNPLFMVNAVDYLMAAGLIAEFEGSERWELAVEIEKVEVGVPDSIKQMIEKQVDHLDAIDQRTLEAASVAGAEFSTLAVVAGLGEDRAAVEARCEGLAFRRQFIKDCGVQELPNGEAVARYGFIHALYQNTLYDRLSASRRIQLHRRIAERGEDVYGERAREIAAELAMHFEQGSNHKRAIKYLQQAADNGIRRFAYKEAVGLARRGLELLERLPESPERAEQELCLQLTLGVPLAATKGYAAVDVGNAYLRSRELCQQIGDTPDVSEALWGLWAFHTVRTEFGTARDIAEEFLGLRKRLPYAGIAMRGHLMMGVTLLHLGEFPLALEHLDKAYSAYDHTLHHDDALLYGQNPVVAIRCHASWALWFLGLADLALERIQEALKLARELSEPHGLAHTLYFAANLHQLRREGRLAQEYADAAIAVSREHGLALYEAMATVTRGWSLIEQGSVKEGIEEMRHGLAAHQATGAIVGRPHYLALLSEALGRNGQAEEGLRLLNEALELATKNGETRSPYLAEIYRIKGELLLIQAASRNLSRAATAGKEMVAPDPPEVAQAESCFIQSIKIAQQQNTKSLALCGAMSLVRIRQQYGKQEQARGLLIEILDTFTEGFDIADLREAKSLAELS